MSTIKNVSEILIQLRPSEIMEVCFPEEDTEEIVYALQDHIEDNLENIESELVLNGLMEEYDE